MHAENGAAVRRQGGSVRERGAIDPRIWLLGGLAVLAVPPTIVGISALGLRPTWVGAVVTLAATAAIWHWWRRLPDSFATVMRGRHLLLTLWVALVLVAGYHTVRLGVFMHDAARADLSVLPDRAFFRTHACLSAYTEASRLAPEGQNVYDPQAYLNRQVGRLEVDLFQYPPAFLVLGGVLRLGSEDFEVNRAAWFLVQSLGLLTAALGLALWIGGTAGARLAWLIPLVWVATPTLLTLQIGNFQLSALAWSTGAMVLVMTGWPVLAGALLGFCAAGKIFPGVLGLYLLARLRWRAVLWTGAWALAWLVVAIAWFGMKPQWDFLLYQVPRIQSGEAFFWVDSPDVAGINYSIYGLVARLRAAGVPGATREVGNGLASVFGGVVLLLAAWAGWRRRRRHLDDPDARVEEAALWLALLNLGSLRSPFVPDAYAFFGSVWLATLVWSGLTRRTAAAGALLAILFAGFTRVFDGMLPDGATTPAWMLGLTLAIQVGALAFNGWVVWRTVWRASVDPERAGGRPLARATV
jgi:hypothetical protein